MSHNVHIASEQGDFPYIFTLQRKILLYIYLKNIKTIYHHNMLAPYIGLQTHYMLQKGLVKPRGVEVFWISMPVFYPERMFLWKDYVCLGSSQTKLVFRILFNNRSVSKLHHINRAKLFTENSAMARIRDILRGWGPADPGNILKRDSWYSQCTIIASRPKSDQVCRILYQVRWLPQKRMVATLS